MATPKSHAPRRAAAKRSNRKPKRSWNTYVHRSLKAINKQMSISSRAMLVVNSFVDDIFERLATEAASITRTHKKHTLGARELQTAVRVVLPAGLAKHAMAEATKAITNSTR